MLYGSIYRCTCKSVGIKITVEVRVGVQTFQVGIRWSRRLEAGVWLGSNSRLDSAFRITGHSWVGPKPDVVSLDTVLGGRGELAEEDSTVTREREGNRQRRCAGIPEVCMHMSVSPRLRSSFFFPAAFGEQVDSALAKKR